MDKQVEVWIEGVVEKIERFRAAGLDEAVLTLKDYNRLYNLFPESLSKDNCLVFDMPDGMKVRLWPG